jgi:hypothetical protein
VAHTTPSLQTVYLQSTSSHKTSKANQSRLEQVHNPKTLECTTTLEELIVNTSDYTDTPIARFLSESLRVLRLAHRSSDTYRTTRMQLLLHTRSSKKNRLLSNLILICCCMITWRSTNCKSKTPSSRNTQQLTLYSTRSISCNVKCATSTSRFKLLIYA